MFGNLSHKLLNDAALMHFINTTAIVTYCENGSVMPMLRISAGYVSVLGFQSMCETLSHQTI
jgi:hypothetical protein